MSATDRHAELFEAHRPALVGAAYRVLGSLADAEDAVQEVWPRWSRVDLAVVDDPRRYLVGAVTRSALNVGRAQSRRRESYVGPWLPEPVVTGGPGEGGAVGSGPEAVAETADAVSYALMVVLDRLTPAERAAFVLYEVFGVATAEVADALDRTPQAVRQLVSRARRRVRAGQVGDARTAVDRAEHRRVAQRFVDAATGGSLDALLDVLAPEVVLTSDGGGRVSAALRPIEGVDKVLRFLVGVMGRIDGEVRVRLVDVDGDAAIAVSVDGVLDSLSMLRVAGGRVVEVYSVRNPDKLVRVPGA